VLQQQAQRCEVDGDRLSLPPIMFSTSGMLGGIAVHLIPMHGRRAGLPVATGTYLTVNTPATR